MYFLQKTHHSFLALRNTKQHFSTIPGSHFKQQNHHHDHHHHNNKNMKTWKMWHKIYPGEDTGLQYGGPEQEGGCDLALTLDTSRVFAPLCRCMSEKDQDSNEY